MKPNLNRHEVLKAVIKDLSALQLAELSGIGLSDAKELNKDLDALARILDPLFHAIGLEAHHALGMSLRDVEMYFEHPVRTAIEGNLDFCITDAAQAQREYLMDDGYMRAAE